MPSASYHLTRDREAGQVIIYGDVSRVGGSEIVLHQASRHYAVSPAAYRRTRYLLSTGTSERCGMSVRGPEAIPVLEWPAHFF